MTAASQRVVLCEGYLDRAFWKGWLLFLGCCSARQTQDQGVERYRVADPWGDPVVSGHFAYHSRSGRFVRVVPCRSRSRVLPAARFFVQESSSRALDLLVVNRDLDMGSVADPAGAESILGTIRLADPKAQIGADGCIALSTGGRVCLIDWRDPKPRATGAPKKQVLERLICASIAGAYPDRAASVETWLHSRPSPPAADPAEYAWSYMAGWNASLGCEAFFEHVWNDDRVRAELLPRLETTGAAQIAQMVAE